MKKITVIGHFGFGLNYLDGQTVKTKILAEELERRFGSDQVIKIDTHGGIKSLFKAPFQVLSSLSKSKNVIILPAHNGLRIYAPLLSICRVFFKSRKIHYSVIGGWLPSLLKKRPLLAKFLKSFDGIYPETATMKNALQALGFQNIFVVPNCKKLIALSADQLVYSDREPYRLCTFSRVMKEKGIEDAVNAVIAVNEKAEKTAFTLDIYGPIDSEQIQWFEDLQKQFPDFINYKGSVAFDKSVETLSGYCALLFPTRFFTEGIPGTILDAYAAGIPVISSKWESFADVVDHGVTGICYDFNRPQQLENLLHEARLNPQLLSSMKLNCIKKANDFLPENVINTLSEQLA